MQTDVSKTSTEEIPEIPWITRLQPRHKRGLPDSGPDYDLRPPRKAKEILKSDYYYFDDETHGDEKSGKMYVPKALLGSGASGFVFEAEDVRTKAASLSFRSSNQSPCPRKTS